MRNKSFSSDRRKPIGAIMAATSSRSASVCSLVPLTRTTKSSAYAEDRIMPMSGEKDLWGKDFLLVRSA